MILVAPVAALIAPYDPLAIDFGAMLAPPSAAHWLGTDAFGRDVLSRIIYGSRTALIVGFGARVLRRHGRRACSASAAPTSAAGSTSSCSA